MQLPLIENANEAYYSTDTPILTDEEFNLLEEHGLDIDSRNFRTKVRHPVPMMSLDKKKDPESLAKWLNELVMVAIGPKLDGNTIRLTYDKGILVQGATRGDGESGNDVTRNILHTRVPKRLAHPWTCEVRVEAILPKTLANKYDKNLRNIVAGMINAKDPRPDLTYVETVGLAVYGPDFETFAQKMQFLNDFNLAHPPIAKVIPLEDLTAGNFYEHLDQTAYQVWNAETFPFAIDGVVVQALPLGLQTVIPEPGLENPSDQIAVKFGKPAYPAEIGSIEWNLGKHGKLTPVLILKDPVEIDGTNVQRISASNYALLKAAGLGIGAQIGVVKSGDIIPFVKEVYTPSQNGLDIPECPCCQTPATLSETGVDALCLSTSCEGSVLVQLQQTFDVFGIDFISDATIETLYRNGHDTLEKLFALREQDLVAIEGFAEKTASYFVNSLSRLTLTEAQVVKLANLKGIGERKATMLLDHYQGLDNAIDAIQSKGMEKIDNFGPIQTDLLNGHIEKVEAIYTRLKDMGVSITPHPVKNASAMDICCTGTCLVNGTKYSRKELESLLADNGYQMVSSVTKNCGLVLCADADGNSSKLKNARKKGIPIKTYEEFLPDMLDQDSGPRF